MVVSYCPELAYINHCAWPRQRQAIVASLSLFFSCCVLSTLAQPSRAAVVRLSFLRLVRFLSLAGFLPSQIMSRLLITSSVLADGLATPDAPSASHRCVPLKPLPRPRFRSLSRPRISLSPDSLARSPRLGTLHHCQRLGERDT